MVNIPMCYSNPTIINIYITQATDLQTNTYAPYTRAGVVFFFPGLLTCLTPWAYMVFGHATIGRL